MPSHRRLVPFNSVVATYPVDLSSEVNLFDPFTPFSICQALSVSGLWRRRRCPLSAAHVDGSPYEESGDSSDVSRGRSVFAGPKRNLRDTRACSLNPSPHHKITETGENLSRGVPFSAAC
jgi:hypothetical protein